MKHTFTLDAWYRHIKKQLRKQPALSLAEIKQPLISTSVNFSNQKSLIDSKDIIENFSDIVDVIFFTTESTSKLSSTIIDLTTEEPKLIREGSVKFIELLENLK